MHLRKGKKLFETRASKLGTKIASILAIIIDTEVVKTKISFLVSEAINSWQNNGFSSYSFGRSLSLGFF